MNLYERKIGMYEIYDHDLFLSLFQSLSSKVCVASASNLWFITYVKGYHKMTYFENWIFQRPFLAI